MAPPKNLVTGVCIILAVPFGYLGYQLVSPLAAVLVVFLVGVLIPQLYAKVAVPVG